jgi:hypothetical protein
MVVDILSCEEDQCMPMDMCQVVTNFLEPLFKVGDFVDCKDPCDRWYLAEVLQVSPDGNKVFITYTGWPERWNEWIDPLNDGKISRIYEPDSKGSLEEIRVRDKVDFFFFKESRS